MIEGSLLLSASIIKHFQSEKKFKSRFVPKFDGLGDK